METLLCQRDVALALGLSERTLERLRASGAGPKFVKARRAVRYRESDLAEWLATQTVQSTSEAALSRMVEARR
jgi:predicted DNA-binding transcriptional regulator AlpA